MSFSKINVSSRTKNIVELSKEILTVQNVENKLSISTLQVNKDAEVSNNLEPIPKDFEGISNNLSDPVSMLPSTSYDVSINDSNNLSGLFQDLTDDSDKDKTYYPTTDDSSSDNEFFERSPQQKKRKPFLAQPKKYNSFPKIIEINAAHDKGTASEEEPDVDVMFHVSQPVRLENRAERRSKTEIIKRNKDGPFTRKKRGERKEKRNTGLEYMNVKGKKVEARKLRNLDNCRMGCKKLLEGLSDDRIKTIQERIFTEYWALGSHDKRVAYVSSLVDTEQPKRSRKRTHDVEKEKFRLFTHTFHFNVNGKRVKTCKGCFLKVLDETSSFLFVALRNKSASISGTVRPDFRGRHSPVNKHPEGKINEVIKHINSIPRYKSHYTRKESDRWYLPAHLNLQILYNAYVKETESPVSRNIYERELHKLNISFKSPKVDTCHKCGILHMKKSIETDADKLQAIEQELQEHHEEADLAYEKKKLDKFTAISNQDSMRCYMFDLQQCLPTPYLKENVIFYKRQLWTYNLTVHDSTTKNVYCYMWHEGEGGRGGNQIATCIYKLLLSLESKIKHIVFYSDTCLGQNKNSHVAAMFLKAMQENSNLETIDHKFMVSGHSHIECDIDHGAISKQKELLEIPVYGPQDWYQVVRSTGPKKHKFIVNELTYEDFIEFSSLLKGPLQLRKKNDDGEKFSWQCARWFQYRREYGTIFYKNTLNEEEPFMSINLKRRGASEELLNPNKCYKDRLPISQEKKKDLLDILNLIPPSYHNFYKSLKCSDKVASTLPDVEECLEEY